MIRLNENKITYLDKEAMRLVGLMRHMPYPDDNPTMTGGSIKERPSEDWTDRIQNSPFKTSSLLVTGQKLDWIECHKGQCYGFDEKSYPEFETLVNAVKKDKSVDASVSLEFLMNKSFDWFLESFKNYDIESKFSQYIISEINKSIKEYQVHFPVLYIDIENPIPIGNTMMSFYSKEQIDNLEKEFLANNPARKTDNPYSYIRKKLQGQVLISTKVKAEYKKAREIALQECSLAIDTLKLCSLTTIIPDYRLSFDIDSRTRENLENTVIYTDPSAPGAFSFDVYRIPNQYKIDNREWQSMLQNQLYDFHSFLLKKDKKDNELKRLIVNSIRMYATAISSPDLHQRVVRLFTILESLLLPNENSPIIDSVCNYCSKLVFHKVEDRQKLISLLKKMYSVRSAMIHHAIKKKLSLYDLRQLQIAALILLTQLIKRIDIHKSKKSILDEIDDEILRAYKP